MLDYLIKNGYIVSSGINYFGHQTYEPTEKGKACVRSPVDRGASDKISFKCVVAEEYVTGIKEILIDEKSNTALVTYLVTLKPYEPCYSSIYAKSDQSLLGNVRIGKIEQKEISLKKYDKGWKVENR